LSFRKKHSDPLTIPKLQTTFSKPSNKIQQKNIPLTIETLTGAQTKDNVQPSILVFPDDGLFSSNYPSPEFIIKHSDAKSFYPVEATVMSKGSKEWNGFPIA